MPGVVNGRLVDVITAGVNRGCAGVSSSVDMVTGVADVKRDGAATCAGAAGAYVVPCAGVSLCVGDASVGDMVRLPSVDFESETAYML